ncbi:MAG: arylamine N-acetyltransferase [Leptospirales bacterium]|nr:arylamine N-acetyltransferase [Leptospirales bacterium]
MKGSELDAYFERINYHGPRTPTLAALNGISEAHVRAIPFENLDVLLGRDIKLDFDSIFQKLVTGHRGGYCFEQNGLLLTVLESLGFKASALSARVRLGRQRDFIPPRTHMFVRVEIEDEVWLADVGVGGCSLTTAIRLNSADEQTTAHEPRRIVQEDPIWFHQVKFGSEWNDVCEFTLEGMPPIDRELANWFTNRHPDSHFLNRLMVARSLEEGRRVTILNDELSVREKNGLAKTHHIGTAEELLEILDTRFGLKFSAGTRFGRPGSPWPT